MEGTLESAEWAQVDALSTYKRGTAVCEQDRYGQIIKKYPVTFKHLIIYLPQHVRGMHHES